MAKRENPIVKRIRRDAWLSPLTLADDKLSSEPELHTTGLRSSDKGYLNTEWKDYWELLRSTAKQSSAALQSKLPNSLARILSTLGIDASMWRDLVWNWQKYLGKSVCVGSPDSMKQHAGESGRHPYRGQASVPACFT